MRAPYQMILPLFSLFLVRVDLTDLKPLEMGVQILKVYDGDTVLVGKGSYQFKIRLSRIDAPEKAQHFIGTNKNAGHLSKQCLERNLSQSSALSLYGFDMYGRILGDLNGVSLKLIEQGCVSLYPHARFRDRQEKFLFVRSWLKARRNRVGLWAFGGFENPKAWRKKNSFRKRI